MKGTLTPRGDGKWSLAVDLGADPATGKRNRRWRTFAGGKRAAQAELARMVSEAEAGVFIAPSKMTVATFLQHWLDNVKTRTSPKTHERRAEIVAAINLQLGAVKLDALKPIQITTAWTKALESGRRDTGGPLAPSTVALMHRTLRAALRWGVDVELLARNPIAKVRPPAIPKAPLMTYSMGDTAVLIGLLRQERIFVPALLSAMTGCRRAEACALRWRDVDLAGGRLSITRSIEQLNNSVREKATKTGRGRIIALGASVVAALREHKARQAAELAELEIAQDADTFVCAHHDGSMMHPRWLPKKWHAAVKESGLPVRGFHHLRHAHATALLESGIHIKIASERLGHSNVGTTLQVYQHVLPGMQEDAAARIDQAFQAIEEAKAAAAVVFGSPEEKPGGNGCRMVADGQVPNRGPNQTIDT
jgi:integrase